MRLLPRSYLLLVTWLLAACTNITPPSIAPYLNKTYYLSDTTYFVTVQDMMGPASYHLVRPGDKVGIGYDAPALHEYYKNPQSRSYSLLGTTYKIAGIVPLGTPFVLTEYSYSSSGEGALNIKIVLQRGSFVTKQVLIDESILLTSMRLKTIKKDITYWQMGKTYHQEVLVSPFAN